MSRCVKDLRELICISRLSIRQNESSEDDSFDESDRMLSASSHENSTASYIKPTLYDSDKAYIPGHYTSIASNEKRKELVVGRPRSAVGGVRRPISATGREIINENAARYVEKDKKDGFVSLNEDADVARTAESLLCSDKVMRMVDYDDEMIENVLHYVDANVISDWLQRCNHELDLIVEWLRKGHSFINFAFFLLNQFNFLKMKELIDMEVSFILNEFELAFKTGIRDKKLRIKDLRILLDVVLHEYPARLIHRKGLYMLLKILLTFSCGKNETYKQLLSDVKFSTCKKQYIQWLLAMRALCLVSLTNGIINFYKQLISLENYGSDKISKEVNHCDEDIKLIWLMDAIEFNYFDVFKCLIEYFVEKFENFVRNQWQIIISKVITAGSDQILTYLADQIFAEVNWNEPFESGNTPLQVAVNNGKIKIVEILLQKGADANTQNSFTDNATALHMAVVNGQEDILSLLINHGADTSLKLGPPPGVTAKNLASELGNRNFRS